MDIPVKTNGNNDWVAYRALVLTELKTAKEERKEITKKDIKLGSNTDHLIRKDTR